MAEVLRMEMHLNLTLENYLQDLGSDTSSSAHGVGCGPLQQYPCEFKRPDCEIMSNLQEGKLEKLEMKLFFLPNQGNEKARH